VHIDEAPAVPAVIEVLCVSPCGRWVNSWDFGQRAVPLVVQRVVQTAVHTHGAARRR